MASSSPVAVADRERKPLEFINDDVDFFPHQIEGVRWLAKRTSFILADEMGLGKSLQALTAAAVDFERGRATRVMIVCPATLKGNWYDEIGEHTTFGAMVLDGTPKQRGAQLAEFDEMSPKMFQFLIVNYEQVVRHLEDFNSLNFDIIIYDEAHSIKNPKARRTKAALRIHADRHFLLTGSPLLNHVNELWSLLNRCDPGRFPNYWRFVNRYCNTPDAPVWMADGSFKEIGKVQEGDKVMGWEPQNGRRSRVIATVERVERRIAPDVIEVTLESGNVIRCTPDHLWLAKKNTNAAHDGFSTVRVGQDVFAPIVRKGRGRGMTELSKMVEVPRELNPEEQRQLDWLMGIYDGEGSSDYIAQSLSHSPEIHARIGQVLDVLGLPYRVDNDGYQLKGGVHTFAALLHWNPFFIKRAYFTKRLIQGIRRGKDVNAQANRTPDRIVNVKHVGSGEVVSMQTSTGNYVVWGYASKNCVFGGWQDKQIVGVKNEAELREIVDEYMLRRLKKDVLDLPEKQFINIRVDLTPEQRKLYDQINEDLMLTMPDDPNPMQIENSLTKFLRLKQVCGTTAAFGYEDSSGKLDAAMERVEEIVVDNGEKLVMFTQFRGVMEAFEQRCAKAGVSVAAIHGDTPKRDRVPMIRRWSASSEPGVVACMYQVGGVGLNMTAANKMIRIDKLFVPKMNEQAEDRIHRIGASVSQPVQIYDFIARNTIESRIETILRSKRKIFDSIVDTGDFKKKLIAALMAGEEGDEQDGE